MNRKTKAKSKQIVHDMRHFDPDGPDDEEDALRRLRRGEIVNACHLPKRMTWDETYEVVKLYQRNGTAADGDGDDAKRRLGIVRAKDRPRRRRVVHDMREYLRTTSQRDR